MKDMDRLLNRMLLCLALLLASPSSFAASDCNQTSEGGLVYESASQIGDSVTVINPKVVIGGKSRALAAWTQGYDSAQGFCIQLGYKGGGVTGDVKHIKVGKEELVVQMNELGSPLVTYTTEYFLIRTLTCLKKL